MQAATRNEKTNIQSDPGWPGYRILTIALDRYDRHIPFFLDDLRVSDGIRLKALEVGMLPPRRDGVDRHKRMLVDREFDVSEVSLASYIIAKHRGAPFTAVPVFPRRLFSQNHIFVNVDAKVHKPADLIGKRVGVWAFQVTMSVLAKGDLKSDYGVPWEQIHWVTQHPEEIAWKGDGLPIERAPAGKDLAQMLVSGELDALIHPHPPAIIEERTDRVRRLFPNAVDECVRYHRRHGYFPIMHLLALKAELAEAIPGLPRKLIDVWDEAKRQARDFYRDPGYALMAFARNEYERQIETLGDDPWRSGLAANRANLDRFMEYMVDQKLIPEPLPVEALFHPTVLDT